MHVTSLVLKYNICRLFVLFSWMFVQSFISLSFTGQSVHKQSVSRCRRAQARSCWRRPRRAPTPRSQSQWRHGKQNEHSANNYLVFLLCDLIVLPRLRLNNHVRHNGKCTLVPGSFVCDGGWRHSAEPR